jgi:hypothetical protein
MSNLTDGIAWPIKEMRHVKEEESVVDNGTVIVTSSLFADFDVCFRIVFFACFGLICVLNAFS